MRILISGAGIAGPTLAYWLRRSGHEVTLVEQASALRTGGYVIDFWGLGYEVAERMGVLPRLLEIGYNEETGEIASAKRHQPHEAERAAQQRAAPEPLIHKRNTPGDD